ncbi:hypothetical protein [Staphylococcus haemolyticus]|uniref:hypothetical protein n=1 Tax=Staphylococcus haemolyticus TaxID=1283 RepID=UPI001F0B237D|nr:hypothetical protein [Staphylococcus haemolyticus]MCH4417222.1 hypothetical protein [Staphylococcus haemolyticus]
MLLKKPNEVVILAYENEIDERQLLPNDNIDMLKEECQNLNIKVTKSYTDLDQLINDIEDESITNIPIIVWGHISDYPGLEQSRLDCYSHIDTLPHVQSFINN